MRRARGVATTPLFQCFLKDRKAVTAVEYALIGPVFVFMIAEFFYTSSALNYATKNVARQIMTGAVQSTKLNQAQFINNILCPQLPSTIPCSSVIVNIQTFSSATYPGGFYGFVNNTQTGLVIPPLNNSQTSFCPGGAGQYAYIRILYPMPLLDTFWLPTLNTTYQGQTVALITAAAAFKNEPFQTNYTAPSGC
jgi:Flp pilus assembly protein TadG